MVRIATAQKACHASQGAYFEAKYQELLADLIGKNGGALLELARAAYQQSIWYSIGQGFHFDQAAEIAVAPEQFAKHGLLEALVVFFRENHMGPGLAATGKDSLPAAPVMSSSLSRDQQANLRQLGSSDEGAIRNALATKPTEVQPAFDPQDAVRRINEFERLIAGNQALVESIRTRLGEKPGDPALLDDLREGEATIERQRRNLEGWQNRLIEWRAGQAA